MGPLYPYLHNTGRKPVWSRWAWPITTASISSSVTLAPVQPGIRLAGTPRSGISPRSPAECGIRGWSAACRSGPPDRTRPTSAGRPPTLGPTGGRNMSSPICLSCFTRSALDFRSVLLMVCMVLDDVVVALRTRMRHPISSVIWLWLKRGLRISSHGRFTSSVTSPMASSKNVPRRLASAGMRSASIFWALGLRLADGCVGPHDYALLDGAHQRREFFVLLQQELWGARIDGYAGALVLYLGHAGRPAVCLRSMVAMMFWLGGSFCPFFLYNYTTKVESRPSSARLSAGGTPPCP